MSRSKDYERECPCPAPEACRRKDGPGHRVRYLVRFEKPPGPDGRRRQGKKRFRTTDEAKKFRAATITAVATGTYTDPSRELLSKYLRAWLARKARTLRPGTIGDYTWRVEKLIIPNIGGVQVGRTKVATLDDLFDAIADDDGHDLNATSLHSVLAVLSSALTDAVERGLIASNPCRNYGKYHLPPRGTPKVAPWTAAQTSTFLTHAEKDRYALLWRIYVLYGLRRGEGIGLRWADIDLDAGRMTIAQAVTLAAGKVVVGKPKTAAGEDRVAVLDAGTIAGLKAHRKSQAAERLRAGAAYEDGGMVFADELGRMLHPAAISARFRRMTAAAGLRRIRLHDLRHGAVSLLLDAGIPLPTVSKLVGHSSVRITADTYGHLVEGRAEAAADAVVALLAKASGS